jgi:hypothetical protein
MSSPDAEKKPVAKSDCDCENGNPGALGSVTFSQSSPDKAMFKSASPNSDIPSNSDSQSPSERDKETEKTGLEFSSGIELVTKDPDEVSAKQTRAVFTSELVIKSRVGSDEGTGKVVLSQAIELGKDSKDSDMLNLAADPGSFILNDKSAIFKTKLQGEEKNTVASKEKMTDDSKLPTNCYKGISVYQLNLIKF